MTPAPTSDTVADRLRAVQELYDRGESISSLVALAREPGLGPAERREVDREALAGPLGLRLEAAAKRGATRRREAITALRPYLAEVDPRVKRDLPVGRRAVYHLIETRDPGELAESDALAKLAAAAAEPSRRVRKGLRWYADLPVEVDDKLLRLRKADLVPVTQIDDISWVGGRLRITGHAYLAGLSVRSRRFNRATVVLKGPRWLPRVRLKTRRIYHPEATHAAKEPGCNYDWAGFTAELHPFSLRWRAGLRAVVRGGKRLLKRRRTVQDTTTWRAEIAIWSRMARATGPLRGPAIGRTERPAGLRVKPRWWVRPVWTSDKALQVVLQPTRAELTGVRREGDNVVLTGFVPGHPVTRGKARVGGHRMAAEFAPVEGGSEFSLVLGVPTLLKDRDARRLWVEPKGEPAAAVMLEGGEETRIIVGDREITVQGDRRDRVIVSGHKILPVITSADWRDDTLTLTGRYPDPDPGPRDMLLRHRGGLIIRVPLQRDGEEFSVRLAPGAMPRFGGTVPLAEGIWSISVAPPGKHGPAVAPARFDHAGLDALDEERRTIDGRVYRFVATRYDVPVLVTAEDRPGDERSAAGVWALSRNFYPSERSQPLREAAVYVSSDGRSYSDSPRAIYEERVRRGDDSEHIWVVRDGAFIPPGSAELGLPGDIVPKVVREGSREHYEALARSRYVVSNGFLPPWFRTRDDQICVQTWHGTPVKHIGRDLPHMRREPRPPVWHRQAVEVRGWDVLVSQSPWASSVLRKAFGYEGEILECGYPRNDVLVGDREPAASAIRRRVGVPEGKRVILYAPTFRDYDRRNASVKLDLVDARRALGTDHVVLVRGHAMQAFPHVPSLDGFAIDVTTYPDMADLLLIADVLVTDYSSSMFDFVASGRPVVLFTPDLDRYRGAREIYLDLESQRPGPRLATSPEVVEVLRTIDSVHAKLADRYASFVQTYAPNENGKAAARLVDHVFSS
ncbi:CDP-glycerol glycerophosphotransferase family protein [Microtetraspora malaysiensis]|uniref:CDP-glycerol glycerophosphotransferase family protein n=1 Tax=Microtetraspora malaysiensis TaxID=161358 RepID=A0ABW6SME7_9ACTN